jgi:hypothetical protein
MVRQGSRRAALVLVALLAACSRPSKPFVIPDAARIEYAEAVELLALMGEEGGAAAREGRWQSLGTAGIQRPAFRVKMTS